MTSGTTSSGKISRYSFYYDFLLPNRKLGILICSGLGCTSCPFGGSVDGVRCCQYSDSVELELKSEFGIASKLQLI